MECNFCKSVLKTSSSLNYHKKNNKKCLDVQKNISNNNNNINSILIQCSFCNIQFTNIKKHLKTCKVKKIKDFENINSSNNQLQLIIDKLESNNNKLKLDNKHLELVNELLNNEKNDLLNDINKSKNEINDMKEYIIKLETENNIYSKDHDTITTIAKQPKTTNNNYNLSIYDDNIIKDRFSIAINNIKPSDLYDGQKSIGRFVVPCLQNDDGSKMISCTDFARNVFIYKDVNGNINKDIKCKNLANLIEPIATAKVNELMKEDCDKRTKINRFKFLRKHIISRKEEIEKLENHLQGLKKETQQWYYIKSQILQKENDIEIFNNELENINYEIEQDNEYCNEKLIIAADDIKEMKTDSSKFSKTISELV
jgi:chromosome segregation ATPase